jgi:pimeloyl-ACP methyl ester carboxylesterase
MEQLQHNLYVQSTGPAAAPSIVFLHGGGAGGWMWQPHVTQLADYHCLVPDLPEHGHSKDVKPFTMEGAAGLVADLIRTQAHGGRAHVVGLSEGAQVVVALLSSAPELVRSAIISSASLRPLPGTGLLTPGVLAATYNSSVAPFRNWDAWIRLNMKYAAGVPDQYFVQFKQDFQSLGKDAWVHLMRANLTFRLPHGLERATTPALVVVGAKEYAAMRQSARDLAAALPNAHAYTVNLGRKASLAQEHNWALTAPGIFTAMVRAWIEHTPLPAALQALGPHLR